MTKKQEPQPVNTDESIQFMYHSHIEPQPATCPACGHKISEHDCVAGCMVLVGEGKFCSCLRTSIDLQPEKHCNLGHDWKCSECPNSISDVSDNLSHTQRCMHSVKQPTPTMPLRVEDGYAFLGDPQYKEAFDKGVALGKFTQLWEDMKSLKAHDSTIASKAVKEFAEKVIKVLPYATQGEVVHIRAMAEE